MTTFHLHVKLADNRTGPDQPKRTPELYEIVAAVLEWLNKEFRSAKTAIVINPENLSLDISITPAWWKEGKTEKMMVIGTLVHTKWIAPRDTFGFEMSERKTIHVKALTTQDQS